MKTIPVIGCNVSSLGSDAALDTIVNWASGNESKYICFTNVHMVMEAYDDASFRKVVNNASLSLPDGAPVAWVIGKALRRKHGRVSGPETMTCLFKEAENKGLPIGFLGGSEMTLDAVEARLKSEHPNLGLVFRESPMYAGRGLEDPEVCARINASGVRLLFVALGCPKQEKWMVANTQHLNCVMLGIGAAVDFYGGTLTRAPESYQKLGLEWLFRFIREPGRLWKRYAKHNPRFIALSILDLWSKRLLKLVPADL